MSSKPPKNTTTTTQQTFSPEEMDARNKLFAEGANAYDQQKAVLANTSNPAAAPVGPSAATLHAQNMLQQYANGAQGSVNDLNSAVNYGLNGAMDVNNNTHLQGAIDAATRAIGRNYTDPNGVLANIRSSAISNGSYGGTRQGLGEGVAAGRYATEIGDVANTMASAAYDKGQDTFARTLGLAPGALTAGMIPAQALSSVGAQQESYAQMLEDYNAAGRVYELNKPFAAVANYANLINGIQAPGTSATNSVSGNGAAGSAMGMIGGGLSGAMMGARLGPIGMAVGGGLGVLSGLF